MFCRKFAALAVVSFIVVSGLGGGEARADEYGDALVWDRTQGKASSRTTPETTRTIEADRLDLGGTLIPSLQIPVLVTDPYATNRAVNATEKTSTGYGLEWRIGYALGRFSLEALGGFSHVSRDPVVLASGKSIDLALDRAWFGGQLRYTHVNSSIFAPFAGAGMTAEYWSLDTVFRNGGRFVTADAVLTPAIHAMLGTYARLFSVGELATLFAEGGLRVGYAFADEIAGSNQVFVIPWIGMTVMAARPPILSSPAPQAPNREDSHASR